MIIRPIAVEEMVELCGLRISQKTGWLWSLYISARALSGYAREGFEVLEKIESKGISCPNPHFDNILVML